MTDKEKDICGMAQTMCCTPNTEICPDCHESYVEGNDCMALSYARALYEAGYRKADEVRKETAREIALEIKSTIDCVSAPEIPLLLDILDMLKEEYGVEVEG